MVTGSGKRFVRSAVGRLEVDRRRALQLFMRLAAIPGPPGREGEVSEFIVDRLRRAGAPADAIHADRAGRRSFLKSDVGNLVLRLPGTRRAPRRMLMTHMDTVPICVGSQPVVRGNRVVSADPETGVGADNRAGCAVLLNAAVHVLRRGMPHPPLTFLWTVQEEVGLHGARLVNRQMLGRPRLAFNWDGGAPDKLTIGATGGYRMEIDVFGIASHAAVAPEQGVSAVAIAALAVADLHDNGWHGEVVKGHRRGTANVGAIHGGEATNVVSNHVRLKAEARSHDPVFRRRILDRIERAFHRAASSVKNAAGKCGKVTVNGHLDYESYCLATDEPCIEAARRAVETIGGRAEFAIANGGLDTNWMFRHGISAVSLGCGQIGQHKAGESLDVRQFHKACRIAVHLATDVGSPDDETK